MGIFKLKLKVGDTVKVLSGAQKGKTGKVTAIHPKLNKVTVEGVNVIKRHRKPTQKLPQGGIMEETKPIWAAKVAIVHPSDKNKTSRIGYTVGKDGAKKRTYRQAGNKEIK